MTDGSKPLSVLQLQARPSDAERLARQQRDQHARLQELQSQRDEALQQAHAAQQELEQLRASLARTQEELTQHRRQLAAATQLFWEDRARIARLEEERRALNAQLDRLRLGLLELAETPAAQKIRQALLRLV